MSRQWVISKNWRARAKAAIADADLELALKYLQKAQEIEDTPCIRRRINRIRSAIRETGGPRERSELSSTKSDSEEIDLNQNTSKKRKISNDEWARRTNSATLSPSTAKGSFVVKTF